MAPKIHMKMTQLIHKYQTNTMNYISKNTTNSYSFMFIHTFIQTLLIMFTAHLSKSVQT